VSAIKCTRLGGRAGIPDLCTVENFLKNGIIDYMNIDHRVDFYRNIMFESSDRGTDQKRVNNIGDCK
jgi:hypothetical protein